MVLIGPVVAVAITLAVAPGVTCGQTKGDEPIGTTPCEMVKTPERFNGKIISVRGRVLIAFEDFRLDTSHCDGSRVENVWLEYGRGPKHQPTTWCCGDMVPRDPLRVVQNDDFKKFHRYLKAQSNAKGCHEGECYLYEVAATITGRLDTAPTGPCPHGVHQCCPKGGFGHFGMSCGRLVIQSVSDVVAKSTERGVSAAAPPGRN
ncbi:MAG: hypothetical protein ACLQBJ_08060 [Bryobacteraceae bacterium]